MYKQCDNPQRVCLNPVHGAGTLCPACTRNMGKAVSDYASRVMSKFTAAHVGGTRDMVAFRVAETLEAELPLGMSYDVRHASSGRVEPGHVRVTLEVHNAFKAARRGRALTRVQRWHRAAFGLGLALGTAVGMLLEALRQGVLG